MSEDETLQSQARLARNVTHALGNMLTVICGNLDLAVDDIENGHPVDGALVKRAQAASRRAGEMLAGLRAFYGTACAMRDTDLSAWWAAQERELGHRVSRWSGPPSGSQASLDPDDLARAIKAIATLLAEDGTISGALSVEGGGDLCLTLSLRGILPAPDQDCSAFEPFAFGEAAAVGLSAAWGAAMRAGGNISTSSDGDGSLTVTLRLPRHGALTARTQ